MSFAVFQQITQSTVIDACTISSFTSTSARNLIFNKGDHLEVYELQRGKKNQLSFVCLVSLFGRPEAIASFRPSPNAAEHLALVFRSGKYLSVLRYDADFGAVRTCAQSVMIAPDDPAIQGGVAGFHPQVTVDPAQRCLAVRVLPDRVVAYPIVSAGGEWQYESSPVVSQQSGLPLHQDSEHPPGIASPFSFNAAALRLHHIEDFAFLHGYHQPTLACLGQAKPSWGGILMDKSLRDSSVVVVVLDLAERAPHLIWATHGLPHDLWRLVPLHSPVTGILALSTNAAFYLKEHGSSFCQMLNASTVLCDEFSKLDMAVKDESKLDISLADCAVTVLEPTVVMLSVQPTGRLYLAHLILGSRDTVGDIIWTTPGQATPALDLCTVGEDHVFVVSSAGNSPLLHVKQIQKKLPAQLQPPKKKARVAPKAAVKGSNGAGKSKEMVELLALHDSLRDGARFIRSYTLEVIDEMQSFGSIKCFVPWCIDRADDEEPALCGTARFIFCSASGPTGCKGSLYIIQRGVPLEGLVEFDVAPQCSAVWTLPQPAEEPLIVATADAGSKTNQGVAGASDQEEAAAAAVASAALEDKGLNHRLVLVSGLGKSMVLQATAEIEEISASTPLDVSATTVCAGTVLQHRLAVQVSVQRVQFMWSRDPKCKEVPQPIAFETRQACGGAVCDPYIAVLFKDGSLRVFVVLEGVAGGAPRIRDLSEMLPATFNQQALCVSAFCDRRAGTAFLTVVTSAAHGTLQVLDLRRMTEVFRAECLSQVPPVLRSSGGCDLDHLRALTDVCALLPKSAVADAKMVKVKQAEVDNPSTLGSSGSSIAGASTTDIASSIIAAELLFVDPSDLGPTLVVLVVGRPVLLYRAFLTSEPDAKKSFPYSFSLMEHQFCGLVQSRPAAPYHPVASFRHPGAGLAGAVIVPPHCGIPALFLVASHNRLMVHPLPGDQIRGLSGLNAECCDRGFFALSQSEGAVAAQILEFSRLEGLPEESSGFELRAPIPYARVTLQQSPQCLATRPTDNAIALAVSEIGLESPEPAGPTMEEDPLSDDLTIVRVPPVEAEPPPVPRFQPRHELWIDQAKDLSKLGQYRFSFDADEHVLCMAWVTLPSFPNPSLAVGTGVNTGEDLTCRGRLLIFSTKGREPGVLPATYQRSLKWPVTVIGQLGNYFVHSEGFKLFFERWENGNFNKLAFFDGSMCITALSSIKNFLLLGDLRKGIDFAQWKEDASTQTRNLRRLSRSSPSTTMTVLSCEFVVCGKSLGLVALDHSGSAHLFEYKPHSDGREGDQLLRSCASFAMGYPCRAAIRMQSDAAVQGLFMATAGGELTCLKPIDDQVYRTATTLLGMLATRLPFRCGLNPRAFRHHEGPPALVAPRKNIEDTALLRLYAFLSTPLQKLIADKMRLSVSSLLRTTAPCASCQLFALRPEDNSGAT